MPMHTVAILAIFAFQHGQCADLGNVANDAKMKIAKANPKMEYKSLESEKRAVIVVAEKLSKSVGVIDKERYAAGIVRYWERLRTGPDRLPITMLLDTKAFEKLAASAGSVIIVTMPDGATVRVNNRYDHSEMTNMILYEKPGKHTIKLSKEGYEDASTEVTLKKATLADTIIIKLKKKP